MRLTDAAALLRVQWPTLRRDDRRLQRCLNVDDLRVAARRRLPRGAFDYLDGAAEDEVTMHRNRTVFGDLELVPRVLRDVGDVDLSTTVLGTPSALPLVLGPTGFTRMFHRDGELAVAAAAAAAGVPYTASTLGTTSLEDVAAQGEGPLWFQLYVWRDRGLCRELVERARGAGYRALVLTVDTAVPGARERDLRNGLAIPPALTARALLDGARHPRWAYGLLTSDAITFANVRHVAPGPTEVMRFVGEQFDPRVSWDDLAWLRGVWDGPLVLKGVLSPPDARRAADLGVEGLVVSNHGGRQLDHVPAALSALERVVDAVGADVEVLVDSGFRRGTDLLKALALGARAVLVGRPYLYGLAAGGEAGVDRVLQILGDELRRGMQLVGATSVADLDASYLHRR